MKPHRRSVPQRKHGGQISKIGKRLPRGTWFEIRDDETCCFAPGRRFYQAEFLKCLMLGIWPHRMVIMDAQRTRYVVHQALQALVTYDGLVLKAVRLPSGSITLERGRKVR